MRIAAPITHHRLTRLHRWAILWLNWFAAFLAEACEFAPLPNDVRAIAHSWLDEIERLVLDIAIRRAAPHVRLTRAVITGLGRQAGVRRAIVGSRLRRSLRAKDLCIRAAALSRKIDVFVARILRRLPRGLTRRRALHTRPELNAVQLARLFATALAARDTS